MLPTLHDGYPPCLSDKMGCRAGLVTGKDSSLGPQTVRVPLFLEGAEAPWVPNSVVWGGAPSRHEYVPTARLGRHELKTGPGKATGTHPTPLRVTSLLQCPGSRVATVAVRRGPPTPCLGLAACFASPSLAPFSGCFPAASSLWPLSGLGGMREAVTIF